MEEFLKVFWQFFWPVFWVVIFVGLVFIFFYVIGILRETYVIMKTATSVSEQIQAIADLVDDIRTKAKMGVFVDVLEGSKRLFGKFAKKSHKKHDESEDKD